MNRILTPAIMLMALIVLAACGGEAAGSEPIAPAPVKQVEAPPPVNEEPPDPSNDGSGPIARAAPDPNDAPPAAQLASVTQTSTLSESGEVTDRATMAQPVYTRSANLHDKDTSTVEENIVINRGANNTALNLNVLSPARIDGVYSNAELPELDDRELKRHIIDYGGYGNHHWTGNVGEKLEYEVRVHRGTDQTDYYSYGQHVGNSRLRISVDMD